MFYLNFLRRIRIVYFDLHADQQLQFLQITTYLVWTLFSAINLINVYWLKTFLYMILIYISFCWILYTSNSYILKCKKLLFVCRRKSTVSLNLFSVHEDNIRKEIVVTIVCTFCAYKYFFKLSCLVFFL